MMSLKSEAVMSSAQTANGLRRSSLKSGDAMEIIKHFYQEAVESTSIMSLGAETHTPRLMLSAFTARRPIKRSSGIEIYFRMF